MSCTPCSAAGRDTLQASCRTSPEHAAKNAASRQAVADSLADIDPDIAVLAEVADPDALPDLLKRMGPKAADSFR